jgi:microsomal dipeptidase-like Zn-dependent dipeptidase
MSDLSVRETAARAAQKILPGAPGIARNVSDAVLAAVADHDGLAGVLRGHRIVLRLYLGGYRREFTCACAASWIADGWSQETQPDLAAHLADVVRAWLKGDA